LTRIRSGAFCSCSSLKSITIPRHVQILYSHCFSFYSSLSSISFEMESELTCIKSNAFCYCVSLKSITIPRYVQILGSTCFAFCKSLSSVSFETHSELECIEQEAFDATPLSLVVIPESASFVADDAFPSCCTVTYSNMRFGE
jgi:hypothetical protein